MSIRETVEALLKAIARKVRALTGGILHPKPTGFDPQRSFQDAFPNFPAAFLNFSPVVIIFNSLFPSHLCEFQAFPSKTQLKTDCEPLNRAGIIPP